MIYLQNDEQVFLKTRKHWFLILRDALGLLLIYLAPFLFFFWYSAFIAPSGGALSGVEPELLLFAGALWSLFIWMKLFSIFSNYFLDIWIVTDRRLIHIDQEHFFSRSVSTLRLERVQDVSVEVRGFFATILGYGDIHVQTAGQEAAFESEGIPSPERVKTVVLAQVDRITERAA